jgi:hypothetical protein
MQLKQELIKVHSEINSLSDKIEALKSKQQNLFNMYDQAVY